VARRTTVLGRTGKAPYVDVANESPQPTEEDGMKAGYYVPRKGRLLRDFDQTARLVTRFVVERHDREYAERLHRDARQEYEAIIPQIPHLEGARATMLNAFLRATAQEVAVYKAVTKHGKTPQEAWRICHEAIRRRMEKFPRWKVWLLRQLMHSSWVKRRMRQRAEKGERLRFGEFEMRALIGDGDDFDWGVDYLACGNLELAKRLGAEEFAPYVCMSDIPLSRALGWDLTRTQTLADGCDHCDFRFKRGGGTHITSKTAEVQETLDGMHAVPPT